MSRRLLIIVESYLKRLLHNIPFCPITASGSNYNPRNTTCIAVVEIIAFLVLGQNWIFFKGLLKRNGEEEKKTVVRPLFSFP